MNTRFAQMSPRELADTDTNALSIEELESWLRAVEAAANAWPVFEHLISYDRYIHLHLRLQNATEDY